MKNLLALTLVALCLCPAVAVPKQTGAPARKATNFTGTWVLDRAASESMDEMMTAEGLSSLERKLYSRLAETLAIEQTPTEVIIKTTTSIVTDTQNLITDGSPHTREVFRIGQVTSRTNWDADGKTLVTETELTAGDGSPAHGTVRRSLEDKGASLIQVLSLELADHKVIKARRVYRRQPLS
jgi:hypothetical protein